MGRKGVPDRRSTPQRAPRGFVHLALCLNYTGTAFRGLQIQAAGPTHHTVEGVLLQAMKDIGVIAELARGRPRDAAHHFARSCRTDRGVHAIRNLVSLFVEEKRFTQAGGCDGIQEKLNAALLPAIHISKVSLVRGSFIPRNCCNRRVYRYLLPAYALLAPSDGWATLSRYHPKWGEGMDALAAHLLSLPGRAGQGNDAPANLFLNLKDANALPPTLAETGTPSFLSALTHTVERCNTVIQDHYVGHHRFHNFCVDAQPQPGQPRASASKVVRADSEESARMIYRCEIVPRLYLLPNNAQTNAFSDTTSQPCAAGVSLQEYRDNCTIAPELNAEGEAVPALTTDGVTPGSAYLPFLLFQVEGGSFLFNMIRKMVGSLLAVCRGASVNMLSEALSPERTVNTPLAPGPYLFLALSTYRGYDSSVEAAATQAPAELTDIAKTDEARHKYRPLREEWSGAVARDCERFAAQVVTRDVIDVDLARTPLLDEMLAARDRARRVTRPQWVEEDAHLAEMKEYTPAEDVVKRNRAFALAKAGVPATTAPLSEMTRFLRMLRVHNWAVKSVKLPETSKAMLEVKNKRARLEDVKVDAEEPECQVGARPTVAVEKDNAANSATSVGPPVPDGGEDGWVYAGADEAEESAMRQAYFALRWKRSRPWEYTTAAEPAAAAAGQEGCATDAGSEDGDDEASVAGSE